VWRLSIFGRVPAKEGNCGMGVQRKYRKTNRCGMEENARRRSGLNSNMKKALLGLQTQDGCS